MSDTSTPHLAERNGGPYRVLVVDDNDDSAASMAMLLQIYGHDARVANDGERCLEVAREFAPHAVVLDIGLPGMDGYEVARRLRELPQTREALLIALTGYGHAEDRRRALEAGFNHHLVKPVDPNDLAALIAPAK
jgi:two-component system, OmpR family, response regulator